MPSARRSFTKPGWKKHKRTWRGSVFRSESHYMSDNFCSIRHRNLIADETQVLGLPPLVLFCRWLLFLSLNVEPWKIHDTFHTLTWVILLQSIAASGGWGNVKLCVSWKRWRRHYCNLVSKPIERLAWLVSEKLKSWLHVDADCAQTYIWVKYLVVSC